MSGMQEFSGDTLFCMSLEVSVIHSAIRCDRYPWSCSSTYRVKNRQNITEATKITRRHFTEGFDYHLAVAGSLTHQG